MAKKIPLNIFKPKNSRATFSRPEGAGNFDNMDDMNFVKSINCMQGTIDHVPSQDKDIANKKYVDDNSGGAPEGTAVKSTGEVASLVLTTDGDNTCSWQAAGAGDVTAAAVMTDNTIVRGDGGAKGVQDCSITIDDADNVANMGTLSCGALTINAVEIVGADGEVNAAAIEDKFLRNDGADSTSGMLTTAGLTVNAIEIVGADGEVNKAAVEDSGNWDTAYSHSQDNTQAHSDYLLNSGADTAVGPLTTTADNSSADTMYIPNVLYNTDDTPPAANTTPIGTIYIQYTA